MLNSDAPLPIRHSRRNIRCLPMVSMVLAACSMGAAAWVQPEQNGAAGDNAQNGPVASAPASSQASQPTATQSSQPASRPFGEINKELNDSAAELKPDAIQKRIAQVETATDMDASLRVELLSAYRQTLEIVKQAAGYESKIANFAREGEKTPELTERLRKRLDYLRTPAGSAPVLLPVDEDTLAEYERKLAQAKEFLDEAQANENSVQADESLRQAQRKAVPQQKAEAGTKLAGVLKSLGEPGPAEMAPDLRLARRNLLIAQKRALELERASYDAEMAFYDSRNDLLALRKDVARLQVQRTQSQISGWQKRVNEKRQMEIASQQTAAKEAVQSVPLPLQDDARINSELVDERAKLAIEVKETQNQQTDVDRRAKELEAHQNDAAGKTSNARLRQYFGQELRKYRRELPDPHVQQREMRESEARLEEISIRLEQIADMRGAIVDTAIATSDRLTELKLKYPAVPLEKLEPALTTLFSDRLAAIDSLRKELEGQRAALLKLIESRGTLLTQAASLEQLINEHVFWIRSAKPIWEQPPPADSLKYVDALWPLANAMLDDAVMHPVRYGVVLFIVILLTSLRGLLLRRLIEHGKLVSRAATDNIWRTAAAFVDTILIAIPSPILMWFIGRRFTQCPSLDNAEAFDLAQSFGTALMVGAVLLLAIRFVRQTLRTDGLAIDHFRWDTSGVKMARRYLFLMASIALPLTVIVIAAESTSYSDLRDFVGRLAFMLVLVLLTFVNYRVLSPSNGVFSSRLRRSNAVLIHRLRVIWYPAALIVPIALIAASAVGYYFTAYQISVRLTLTVGVLSIILLARAVMVRMLFAAQRKVAIEQAKTKKANTESGTGTGSGDIDYAGIDEKIDLVAVSEQTYALMRVAMIAGLLAGLWLIWSDTLPSLNFVNDVKIWSYMVDTPVDGIDGAEATVKKDVVWVTLGNLMLTLLIAFAAIVLTRNIPGLLEITILQRLPLDRGGRFAITTLARYLITMVGVLVCAAELGFAWSQVQWLLAAMSVGLGFGLQEIFANFVCGLIILFERPVRVGDIVTVDGMEGRVTRIRIRATTILDWDHRELVIPNKEFVTGRLINWTLTDAITRLVFPVGVAYGSDTRKARELLLQSAQESEYSMSDPGPSVVFRSFGDSALLMELRIFLADRDYWMFAMNDINTRIDDLFRQNNIEIAFPQQDIHIRSVDATLPFKGEIIGGRPGTAES